MIRSHNTDKLSRFDGAYLPKAKKLKAIHAEALGKPLHLFRQMFRVTAIGCSLVAACSLLSTTSWAGNPILKNTDPNFLYAADPSAEVFNGKVYVYCSRDQPDATAYSSMQDYMILESSDMVNWTNHGVVLEPRTAAGFEYATGQMNAPDAAYKDGWYYWYFPFETTYVGVAKSQSPTGPWESAISGTLEDGPDAAITTIFDPTVFVDDDGQAYIYGNDHKVNIGDPGAHLMGAKLKDNMVELDGPWYRLSERTVNEAVTIFKRNGVYYFMARVGADTDYFMADCPLPNASHPDFPETTVHNEAVTGYASYKGILAENAPNAPDHGSVIEFNGQWYFFYQRGDVNNGTNHRRSACVDLMTFNPDGTIQEIVYTLDTPASLPEVHGTNRQEAEDYVAESGVVVESSSDSGGGDQLGFIQNGDWASYANIDFGNDANAVIPFYVRASSKNSGGNIELRLNSLTDPIIGTVTVPTTGSWTTYETFQTTLTGITGEHTLYLTFTGVSGNLLNLNWFDWTPPSNDPLARWPLEAGSGEALTDSTGNGFDAVFSGGNWVFAQDGGYALNFDGLDASVELPAYLFDSVRQEVTIAMWVFGAAAQPQNDTLFIAEDDSGTRMLNIELPWGNSEVSWDAGDGTGGGTGYDRISKAAVGSEVSGKWNHWVFIKDAIAGSMEIYLNGTLWESGTGKNLPIGTITKARLGSSVGSSYFEGIIDDVIVYNVALSDAQVEELYQKPGLYRDWIESTGLANSDAAQLSNPDADGLLNLAEYALGGNPLGPDSVEILPGAAIPIDQSTVEYSYRRRLDAADRGLSYVVKTTSDLSDSGSWTTDGITPTVFSPTALDAEFELVTVQIPLGTQGFIRLEIEMAP